MFKKTNYALILKDFNFLYIALELNSSSICIKRLYLAILSDLDIEPVLICPVPIPTTKSAMNVSSVSPERCETTDTHPAFLASRIVSTVSDTVPIWFNLIKTALDHFPLIPSLTIVGFVQYKSSPTICKDLPYFLVKSFQPLLSFSLKPSSIEIIGNFLVNDAK
jgi:hypothetical protein